MNALVSIIVPVYNGEKFIETCIESIANSTYKPIEIIIVNDGSSDNTAEICNKMETKYDFIKVIHQDNKGVSVARNIGIDNASGEYISFVDADDKLFPYSIDILMQRAIETDADMTVGKLREDEILPDGILSGDMLLKMSLEDNSIAFSSCRIVYKRSFIGDLRFAQGRTRSEDSFFIFQCSLKKPKVATVNKLVYTYCYIHESTTTSTFTNKSYDDIHYFLEEKGKIIKEMYPELLELYYNLVARISMQLLINIMLHYENNYGYREKTSLREFRKYKKYISSKSPYNKRTFMILKYNLYYPVKFAYRLKKAISKH